MFSHDKEQDEDDYLRRQKKIEELFLKKNPFYGKYYDTLFSLFLNTLGSGIEDETREIVRAAVNNLSKKFIHEIDIDKSFKLAVMGSLIIMVAIEKQTKDEKQRKENKSTAYTQLINDCEDEDLKNNLLAPKKAASYKSFFEHRPQSAYDRSNLLQRLIIDVGARFFSHKIDFDPDSLEPFRHLHKAVPEEFFERAPKNTIEQKIR